MLPRSRTDPRPASPPPSFTSFTVSPKQVSASTAQKECKMNCCLAQHAMMLLASAVWLTATSVIERASEQKDSDGQIIQKDSEDQILSVCMGSVNIFVSTVLIFTALFAPDISDTGIFCDTMQIRSFIALALSLFNVCFGYLMLFTNDTYSTTIALKTNGPVIKTGSQLYVSCLLCVFFSLCCIMCLKSTVNLPCLNKDTCASIHVVTLSSAVVLVSLVGEDEAEVGIALSATTCGLSLLVSFFVKHIETFSNMLCRLWSLAIMCSAISAFAYTTFEGPSVMEQDKANTYVFSTISALSAVYFYSCTICDLLPHCE